MKKIWGFITNKKIDMKRSTTFTIICDVVLIIIFAVVMMAYIKSNAQKNFKQNVENITNIALSNSKLMETALENIGSDVEKAYRYCNNKNLDDVLDYLEMVCAEDEEYQLLYEDVDSSDNYPIFIGYSTKLDSEGKNRNVRYEATALTRSLKDLDPNVDGQECFSQSFTNVSDGFRYFSLFCSLRILVDSEPVKFFLVKPQRESKMLELAQMDYVYDSFAIAFCYLDGRYLAYDSHFRTNNFFDYIYQYNDLSLDQKNELRNSVLSNPEKSGYLEYKDFQGRDCLFSYAITSDENNWLVIVAVPEASFVTSSITNVFPWTVIILLAAILLFNIGRLLSLVNQLKQGMKREIIANSSKSSFLSRMSHEIRTPLNAVIGYNILARNKLEEAKNENQIRDASMKVLDSLEKSALASKHLLTIINDVLDMSAIESGKMKIVQEQFDFKSLISSITTIFYSQARAKGVSLDVNLADLTQEWFIGDQMRTNQILTNLLSNAIKFTSKGGTVKLIIGTPKVEGKVAHMHFEVTDTGIGMSEEYLTHIWTPFEQADSSISRRFGGSGLGLSITKTLVNLMGGTIDVKSKFGEGTTFLVDINFLTVEQPQKLSNSDFSNLNVLVVDDDPSSCDYIKLLLDRSMVKCDTVTSGKQALDMIKNSEEKQDSYNLFIIDWKMPEMDGIDTAREIRKIYHNVPVIVMTAYDTTEVQDLAKDAGVNLFVSKPVFPSTIFDMLINVTSSDTSLFEGAIKKYNFQGKRVILAEDNMMNQEIANGILATTGLEIDNAENGEIALNMFTASKDGTYSAILMDVHMPKMDGYEATRQIRRSSHPQAKTIPIIAMTADAFDENITAALEAGMNDHISKPINPDLLFESLESHMK